MALKRVPKRVHRVTTDQLVKSTKIKTNFGIYNLDDDYYYYDDDDDLMCHSHSHTSSLSLVCYGTQNWICNERTLVRHATVCVFEPFEFIIISYVHALCSMQCVHFAANCLATIIFYVIFIDTTIFMESNSHAQWERLLTKQQNGKITIIISHYTDGETHKHEMSRTIVCVEISGIEQWNYSVWLYMGWRCSQLSLSPSCASRCVWSNAPVNCFCVCIWFLHFVSF